MDKAEQLILVIENSIARYMRELETVQTKDELQYYKGMAFVDLWTYEFLTGDELKAKTLSHSFDVVWKRAQERVLNRLNNPSTK